MTITQRAELDGVLVDVICTGRFYDFFLRESETSLLRRASRFYEIDRMVPVVPGTAPRLDRERWASFPAGYQNLDHLQDRLGCRCAQASPS